MKTEPYRPLLRPKVMIHWLAAISALGIAANSHAALFGPGHLLVSREADHILREVTATGALVQTFTIPSTADPSGVLRDVTVGSNGSAYLYNGTFYPVVTTLNPANGTTSDRTLAGFSTVNNVSYGGIASFGSYVYATDMQTFGTPDGTPKGIVRFDLSNGTATRFATNDAYQDLTIGGNGLLYALPGDSSPNNRIDVFDPNTMTLSRSIAQNITLQTADLRGLAVNYDGSIYAAGWNGTIYALDGNGAIVNTRPTSFSSLIDIDIDSSGRLVVGSRFGDVVLTTTALASQTSFKDPSNDNVFVAWTNPIVPVPEPGNILFGVALVGVLGFRASRRRRNMDHGMAA